MMYPDAIWYPGPPDKQGYPGLAVNEGRGVVCHSMVGSFQGAETRLEGADRVSWHFSVLQSGKVLQHYDPHAVAWHAGTEVWNGRVIGIEHEGGPPDNTSEPLTPLQLDASIRLVHWLSGVFNFSLVRDGTRKGLWEHNEIYQTSCPSHRIPWQYYMGDDDMKPFLAWCPESKSIWLVGPFGAIWVTQASDVTVLEGLYGKTNVSLTASLLNSMIPK